MVIATDRRTRELQGFADETLVVGGEAPVTAVLTPSVYAPAGQRTADRAEIKVEGGDVRYWIGLDSTGANLIPTTTQGFLLNSASDPLVLDSYNKIRHFQAVQAGASPAFLQVLYYR